MSKHTPGPWTIGESERGLHFRSVDAKDHGALASVVWLMEDDDIDGVRSPECEANTRLIAAAPDLLEALSEIINEGGSFVMTQETHRKARAAIAKAMQS